TGLGTPVANNLVTALVNGLIASPNTTGQGLGQVQRQRQGDLTAVKPLAGALGKPTPSTPTKPTNKPDHAAPTPPLQVGADQTVVLFTAPGRTSANAFPVVGEFNILSPQRNDFRSNLEIGPTIPSSQVFPPSPPRLAHSKIDGDAAGIPRVDDTDGDSDSGKGPAATTQPISSFTVVSVVRNSRVGVNKAASTLRAEACDACFTGDNWFSAVSDETIVAL